MELSPSWEAANCANQKVHYRVHKSHPPVRILNQIDPVHTIPSSSVEDRLINKHWAAGWLRTGRGNRSTRRKPAQVPPCPPQISHDLNCDRSRTAAVENLQLAAWAMAWPVSRFDIMKSSEMRKWTEEREEERMDLRNKEVRVRIGEKETEEGWKRDTA
jgi:hypothetical protein